MVLIFETVDDWDLSISEHNDPNSFSSEYEFTFKRQSGTTIKVAAGVEGKYLEIHGIYVKEYAPTDIKKPTGFSTKGGFGYYENATDLGIGNIKYIFKTIIAHVRKKHPTITAISGERITGASMGKTLQHRDKEISLKKLVDN